MDPEEGLIIELLTSFYEEAPFLSGRGSPSVVAEGGQGALVGSQGQPGEQLHKCREIFSTGQLVPAFPVVAQQVEAPCLGRWCSGRVEMR